MSRSGVRLPATTTTSVVAAMLVIAAIKIVRASEAEPVCRVGGNVVPFELAHGLITYGDVRNNDTSLCAVRDGLATASVQYLEQLADVALREPYGQLATGSMQPAVSVTGAPVVAGGTRLRSQGGRLPDTAGTDVPADVWRLGTSDTGTQTHVTDARVGVAYAASGVDFAARNETALALGPAVVEPFGTVLLTVLVDLGGPAAHAGTPDLRWCTYRCLAALNCTEYEAPLFCSQFAVSATVPVPRSQAALRVRLAAEDGDAADTAAYAVVLAYARADTTGDTCAVHVEFYAHDGTYDAAASGVHTVGANAAACAHLSNVVVRLPHNLMLSGAGVAAPEELVHTYQVAVRTATSLEVRCGNYASPCTPYSTTLVACSGTAACGSAGSAGRTLAAVSTDTSGRVTWLALADRTVHAVTCTDAPPVVCATVQHDAATSTTEVDRAAAAFQPTLLVSRLRSGHPAWALVSHTTAGGTEVYCARCNHRECSTQRACRDLPRAVQTVSLTSGAVVPLDLRHAVAPRDSLQGAQRTHVYGYDPATRTVYTSRFADDYLHFESVQPPRWGTVWEGVLRVDATEALPNDATTQGYAQSLEAVYGPQHHPILVMLLGTQRVAVYAMPNDYGVVGVL